MAKKSLTELARLGNTTVMDAQVTFGNPSIGNAGYEPEIVGALFSVIKDGKTTLPLKGKTGVYVIKVKSTTKAAATSNYNAERDQLLNTLKGSVQGQVLTALKKKAEVIDNRKLFQFIFKIDFNHR